jgi:biopolymer transport protein ExbD
MKFPRNARMFRGHLDAAPFAGVFFCLIIFVLLASRLYTPGVSMIQLPESQTELSGVQGPTLAVAMDPKGQLYFQNQIIQAQKLEVRLREEVKKSTEPLTLVVMADKDVTLEKLDRLFDLGKAAGITRFSQARLLRQFDQPGGPGRP